MVRFDHPVDRALNQRATALWPVDRSVDRSKPESGLLTVGRPAQWAGCVHVSVHVRSTATVDRLLARSTVMVDRQNLAAKKKLGLKNWFLISLKIPIKSLKFHKNSFIILH